MFSISLYSNISITRSISVQFIIVFECIDYERYPEDAPRWAEALGWLIVIFVMIWTPVWYVGRFVIAACQNTEGLSLWDVSVLLVVSLIQSCKIKKNKKNMAYIGNTQTVKTQTVQKSFQRVLLIYFEYPLRTSSLSLYQLILYLIPI